MVDISKHLSHYNNSVFSKFDRRIYIITDCTVSVPLLCLETVYLNEVVIYFDHSGFPRLKTRQMSDQ